MKLHKKNKQSCPRPYNCFQINVARMAGYLTGWLLAKLLANFQISVSDRIPPHSHFFTFIFLQLA